MLNFIALEGISEWKSPHDFLFEMHNECAVLQGHEQCIDWKFLFFELCPGIYIMLKNQI